MLLCGIVFSSLTLRKPAVSAAAFGLLALTSGLLLACHGGQQAPAAAPTPSAAPPPVKTPPPPPPPPKCEDLAENCSAGADTQLLVGDSGAWFKPPAGWHYARTPEGSIALNPEGTALMILTPSPDPSDIAPAVEAMATKRGVSGLKVDKLKRRLKKPQQTLPAGQGSVDLWEVDKGQQGGALALADKGKGTLLVLVGKPAPEHTLLGIGFVVESAAEADAPKIMQAVQTLRGAP
jgi:hypothetical protein